MKEQIIYLTTKAQNPYARSITTMANNTSQETPPPPKKEVRQQPPASPSRVEQAMKALEQYKKRYLKGRRASREEEETFAQMEAMAREGKVIPPLLAGGAEELPSAEDLGVDNDALKNIITQINEYARQLGDEGYFSQRYLEQQRERVERLVDEERIPQSQVNQANRLVAVLNEQIQAAGQAEDQAQEEQMLKRTRREAQNYEKLSLTPDQLLDTPFKPTDYPEGELRRIAQEVKDAIDKGEATNDFLRRKVREVSALHGSTADTNAIGKLSVDLQRLKDTLAGKATSLRLDALRSSDYSSYGEIRLNVEEQRDLVQLAVNAVAGDKDARREIDRQYNRLFARADISSSDDWRDALGTAGTIELETFSMTLENASTGRTLPLGRQLTLKEVEGLDQIVRQLKEQAKIREYLHSISYYANRNATIEELHGAVKRFPMEYLDIAYSVRGVTEISHFFEQAMFRVMTKNGWYLPYEAMVNNEDSSYGEVEQVVYDMAHQAVKIGTLPSDMADWEIKRAISLARGLNIATGRTFEIVAFGGIPKETPLVSWWANNVIKRIAFYKQIARYDVGFERNRILAYKLDKRSMFWHPKELGEMNTGEIIARFGGESEDDVLMDKDNPVNVGSIYTQTGWRWGKDEITVAGVVSDLLKGYSLNPLIGVGMWLEKERKMWSNPVHKEWYRAMDADEKRDLLDMFGDEAAQVESKGQRAGFVIRKNLELAAKITPLKLFNNIHGLRADVLKKYYYDSDNPDQSAVEAHEKEEQTMFKDNQAGKNLAKDLSSLGLAQEQLLKKRVSAYQEWVKRGRPENERPNLYTQHTDLEEAIREIFHGTEVAENRTEFVITLAQRIQREFLSPVRTVVRKKGENRSEEQREGHLETLMSNLRHKGWKIPWVFGTDDIPYNLLDYSKTGGSSLDRRWGDIESAEKGVQAMEQLIMKMTDFRSQEDIIKALNEIYQALRGHDENVAAATIFDLTEGIIKFYKKDALNRLPAGLGEFLGFVGGKASFAEIAYGRQQMAWDEIDIDTFIKMVHGAGLLGKGELGQERTKILREHTGGEMWNLAIALSRTAGGMGLLGFLYWFFLQTFPSELKKAA